jgi:hypothetical protein
MSTWLSYIFIVILLFSTSADANNLLFLNCNTSELLSEEQNQFSLVINEKMHSAVLNELTFQKVFFTESQIIGERNASPGLVKGLVIKQAFRLDRITGQFLTYKIHANGDNTDLTEQQKSQLEQLPTKYRPQRFSGSCTKTTRLF